MLLTGTASAFGVDIREDRQHGCQLHDRRPQDIAETDELLQGVGRCRFRPVLSSCRAAWPRRYLGIGSLGPPRSTAARLGPAARRGSPRLVHPRDPGQHLAGPAGVNPGPPIPLPDQLMTRTGRLRRHHRRDRGAQRG